MEEKKKKRPSQRVRNIRRGVLTMLVCMGVLIVIFLVTLAGRERYGRSCPFDEPVRVGKIPTFRLPPSARLLNMQGWWAAAEFEMLPEDLDVFLQSTCLRTSLAATLDAAPAYGFSVDKKEQLARMDSFLYGNYYQPDTYYLQEVLIDTSNPELYIVYIQLVGG